MSPKESRQQPVPEAPTPQLLTRLRLLTEDAARRAADLSPVGQHQALIALDGACERALWLATRARGIAINGQGSVPALHSRLVQAVQVEDPSAPALRGWPAVNQMHEARNSAQHAGVAPNAEDMIGWIDGARQFIGAVCSEFLGVEFDDILMAGEIRDEGLRAQLLRAEEMLADDGLSGAVVTAAEAFDEARNRWRMQLGLPPTQLVHHIYAPGEAPPSASEALEEFVELLPFTSDLSEYLWYRRVVLELDRVWWGPSVPEARRVLVFVIGWIVRWELFSHGYPEDDWAAHRESIEPPTVGVGGNPQIRWASPGVIAEEAGRPSRHVIHFSVANVPGRGRSPWEAILRQALAESARSKDAAPFLAIGWQISGILSVQVALDADPQRTGDAVEAALSLARTRYDAALLESAEREHIRERVEASLAELVSSALETDVPFITNVSVSPDHWFATPGWMAVFDVYSERAGLSEINILQRSLEAVPGLSGNLGQRDRRLGFAFAQLTAEMSAALADAISRAEEEVLRVRDLRSRQDTVVRDFASSLATRFGLPVE